MKRLAALSFAAVVLAGCSISPQQRMRGDALAALSAQLIFQYHDCVPLGWAPVAVAGTYYPGYTATLSSYEMWLDAVWRGRIFKRDLRQRQAREVRAVLDRLVNAGLLESTGTPRAVDYFLQPSAFAYFYGSSSYGNNHDSLPYLCYTTLVPDRIVRMTAVAAPDRWHSPKDQWFDVAFAWKTSAPAGWARDAILQRHSVVLPPVDSPVFAKMYRLNGMWHVVQLRTNAWMLPRLTQPSAWQ